MLSETFNVNLGEVKMSALAKLQRVLSHVDLGFPVPSRPGILTHLGTEVGEWLLGGGTAYALGQIHGRYSHKDGVKHIPALTFAVGKVGALIAGAVGGGPNIVSGGLSTVGQTGLTGRRRVARPTRRCRPRPRVRRE